MEINQELWTQVEARVREKVAEVENSKSQSNMDALIYGIYDDRHHLRFVLLVALVVVVDAEKDPTDDEADDDEPETERSGHASDNQGQC